MNQVVTETSTFGSMNSHAVGRILKETVRRAMVIIQNQRTIFEATAKEGYSGKMDDVFTDADVNAQRAYLRGISECFPTWGIIAEEANLIQEPRDSSLFVTVDPLDGTKAYVRRQSHGVGTMIALIDISIPKIIAAYIGDINTDEVYGFRPGSTRVHRITKLDTSEDLLFSQIHAGVSSAELRESHYALLRDPAEKYSVATNHLLKSFKSYEVSGGSIGIWFARLWKREVSALFLPPGFETPWDSNPIIGISLALGYRFYRPLNDVSSNGSMLWEEYDPQPVLKRSRRDHETLVMFHDDAQALNEVPLTGS